MELLDTGLQADGRILRRLIQAQRLGLPLLTALVAGAADPIVLAARLQLPTQQQRVLQQQQSLLAWLAEVGPEEVSEWSAVDWTKALEGHGLAPEAVAHALELIAREAGEINQPNAFDAKTEHTRAIKTDQPVCMARGERKSWVIASVPIVESAVDVTPRQGQGLAANPQLSSLSR